MPGQTTGLKRPPLWLSALSRHRVAGNFAWAIAGNVTSSGAQWLMVVLLARLAPPEIVGQYTLAAAMAAPVFLLASLHLRNIQATDVVDRHPLSLYLGIRLVTSGAAFTLCVGLAGSTATHPATRATLVIVSLSRLIDAIAETIYGELQRDERLDTIARSMIGRSVLALASFALAAATTQSAVWAAAAACGSSAVVLLSYDLGALRQSGEPLRRLWNRMRPKGNSLVAASKPILRVAAPSGLLLVLVSLNANLPRYFLAGRFSEREVGLFAAMFYLTVAANTLIMALGQSACSRLAQHWTKKNRTGFGRLGAALLGLAALLGATTMAASWLWSEPLLRALYGPEYARQTEPFQWLMTGGALSYVAAACGYILLSARVFVRQIPMLTATTVAMTVALAVLVPAKGLLGAAQGQMIGYAVQAGWSLVLVSGLWRRMRGASR